MKNREAFEQVRKRLDPSLGSQGFGAARDPHHRGIWGWTRPDGPEHLNIWWQSDSHPFDPFTGSQFVMEFELSPEPVPGMSDFDRCRRRLNQLLTEDDRRVMLDLQNTVIGKLRMPTDLEYEKVIGFTPVHLLFDKEFVKVTRAYKEREDVWLRYYDAEDVAMWAGFIDERMQQLLDQFSKQLYAKLDGEPGATSP